MFVHRTRAGARSAAITLVELLVSIALMTILTGTIVFIFIQAQSIFLHTEAKVQVYQNARTTLDQMERDLANVIKTADMEFFNDTRVPPTGHYFKGASPPMEIPIVGAEDDDALYNYAPTMRQPQLYTAFDGRQYRRDSIYFKTITTVTDKTTGLEQTTAALIEYALADRQKERPKLVRKIWHVTRIDTVGGTSKLVVNDKPTSAQPETADLTYYVMDIEFSMYMENKRTGVGGGYYSAQDAVQPKPLMPSNTYAFPAEPNWWAAPDFEIMTFYHHEHDNYQYPGDPDYIIMESTDNGLFHTKRDFKFPMLRPGDRIFLWEPMPPDPSAGQPFPAGDYTIRRFVENYGGTQGVWRVELAEPLSFASLGPASGVGGASTPRQVTLQYRAAWLPPAVRCVMKIKDAKAKELRTISRTFKVLSS